MSLVADYKSSGDEISDVENPSKISEVKKRKRLKRKLKKTFFLPPEIQEALARGVESESDDELDNKINIFGGGKNSNELLSLLPPPAQSSTVDPSKFSFTKISISSSTKREEKNKEKEPEIETIEFEKDEVSTENELGNRINETDKNEEAVPTSKPLLTLASFKKRNHGHILTQPFSLPKTMVESAGVSDISHLNQSLESSVPVTFQQPNSHVPQSQYTHHQISDDMEVEEFKKPNGRKRMRDMERKLLNGNLQDGLADVTEPIINYQGKDPADFDRFAQGEVTTVGNLPAVDVQGIRYNPLTGETEIIRGVNRVQKRKHQINSLAAEAAAKELEIMEKRSAGYRTKAQTQAKYGW